jgi:predicted Zn-dependent protease with MMP-like domain
MLTMGEPEFKEVVREAMDGLPREFRERIQNVAVIVRDEPTREELVSTGLDPEVDTLFGLYDGLSLPERTVSYPEIYPSRITIFRLPLLEECLDRKELIDEIRLTVIHEVGHYFGLSDEDLP